MIWDDVRKQSQLLRDPSIQVIKIPFTLTGNDVWDLLPTRPSTEVGTTVDMSWVKAPFSKFVICPKDEDVCVLVEVNSHRDVYLGSLSEIPEWHFTCDLIAQKQAETGQVAWMGFALATVNGDAMKSYTKGEAVKKTRSLEHLQICSARTGLPCMDSRGRVTNDQMAAASDMLLALAVTTMALMSTKNVSRVLCHPPRQQRRHAERHGLLPPVSWHELVIHPMGQNGSHKGTGQCEPLALHWVRGHWKDYRATGLFGRERSKGMYWWSPHLAGQADRVVFKDYKLETA